MKIKYLKKLFAGGDIIAKIKRYQFCITKGFNLQNANLQYKNHFANNFYKTPSRQDSRML